MSSGLRPCGPCGHTCPTHAAQPSACKTSPPTCLCLHPRPSLPWHCPPPHHTLTHTPRAASPHAPAQAAAPCAVHGDTSHQGVHQPGGSPAARHARKRRPRRRGRRRAPSCGQARRCRDARAARAVAGAGKAAAAGRAAADAGGRGAGGRPAEAAELLVGQLAGHTARGRMRATGRWYPTSSCIADDAICPPTHPPASSRTSQPAFLLLPPLPNAQQQHLAAGRGL